MEPDLDSLFEAGKKQPEGCYELRRCMYADVFAKELCAILGMRADRIVQWNKDDKGIQDYVEMPNWVNLLCQLAIIELPLTVNAHAWIVTAVFRMRDEELIDAFWSVMLMNGEKAAWEFITTRMDSVR